MSKQATRATIDARIHQNGNQEITGTELNSVLKVMVDDYGAQEEVASLDSKVTELEDTINGGGVEYDHTETIEVTNGVTIGSQNSRFYNSVPSGMPTTLALSTTDALSNNPAYTIYAHFVDGTNQNLGNQYDLNASITYTPAKDVDYFYLSMSAGRVTGSGQWSMNVHYSTRSAGLVDNVGNVSELTTTNKTSLVDAVNELNARPVSSSVSRKFMHFSFDDVTSILQDLSNNNYSSMFAEPRLAWMKQMHDSYGAVFSLYVFCDNVNPTTSEVLWSIESLPTKYKAEMANVDWLKFGYHSQNRLTNDATTTSATQYNRAVSALANAFGIEAIDRVPRLQGFAGSLNACKAFRDADCGINGLLTSDNNRADYYLSVSDYDYIHGHERILDATNHLSFFKTDIRLEYYASSSISGFIESMDDLLVELKTLAWSNRATELIVFSHEGLMQIDSYLVKVNIEKLCQFALANGYTFDFPMNR